MYPVDTCGQPKREIGSDLCEARHFSIKRGDRSDGILEMVSRRRPGLLVRLALPVQPAPPGPLALLARLGQPDRQHQQEAGQR